MSELTCFQSTIWCILDKRGDSVSVCLIFLTALLERYQSQSHSNSPVLVSVSATARKNINASDVKHVYLAKINYAVNCCSQ